MSARMLWISETPSVLARDVPQGHPGDPYRDEACGGDEKAVVRQVQETVTNRVYV